MLYSFNITVVPPLDSIYAEFDCNEIEILFLYFNPNRIPTSGSIICDTRNAGTTSQDISPCAAVSNFQHAGIYRISSCRGRNVLLKYKGDDTLQTRQATSISRVGGTIFSRISGGDAKAGMLDFTTNVESADFVFSSTSS